MHKDFRFTDWCVFRHASGSHWVQVPCRNTKKAAFAEAAKLTEAGTDCYVQRQQVFQQRWDFHA
jgi:hypothetical protein